MLFELPVMFGEFTYSSYLLIHNSGVSRVTKNLS